MIDNKLKTLLAVVQYGGYSRAAAALNLTQPAVSYHINQLEEELGITIFYGYKRAPVLTPEGEVLVKYARRLMNISENALRALDDCHRSIRHFNVGITPTVGESLVSRVFAQYCSEHSHAYISIVADDIEKIYDKLLNYELDWAIVDGAIPERRLRTILLDTDYLSLIVAPEHEFVHRRSVSLDMLKSERMILRSETAGTRRMFESVLTRRGMNLRDFSVVLETDNIAVIRDLVMKNMGVSIMAHSAYREDEAAGRLVSVPIDGVQMPRSIQIVYREDFEHAEVFSDVRRIYAMYDA